MPSAVHWKRNFCWASFGLGVISGLKGAWSVKLNLGCVHEYEGWERQKETEMSSYASLSSTSLQQQVLKYHCGGRNSEIRIS